MLSTPSAIDLADRPASYVTSMGPLWVIESDEIERPLLLRRLSRVQGLLRVAPVLKLASTIDHPRLHGPSYWWRKDEGIYVATPLPRGTPLGATKLPRRTWHEALELWRPLADALGVAHGRGVVHGRINPWNVWFDEVTERLTLVDLGCWIGDPTEEDRWCSPELHYSGAVIAPLPSADIHGLARLLVLLGLNEEEASRGRPNFSGLPPYAIPTLERAFDPAPERRPPRIDELVSGVQFQTSNALPRHLNKNEPTSDRSPIKSVLFGRVSAREDITNPRFGTGVRFFLASAQSLDEDARGAFFYEGVDKDIYHSIKWIWDGAELNLLDARQVEDSQGRVFLTSHAETLPVLEPHWPISVTNVLTAERCTSRFLVDERDGGDSGRALVFGNLVHGLLEDLTAPEPLSFDEAIAARIPGLRLAMLAAGLGDNDVPLFVADAREHFENLQKFTRASYPSSDVQADPPQTDQKAERVGWSGRHVEATRYSSLYGIEGRIDLVVEDPKEGLQIIELKSGRPWDGHLSQLRSYTLLWQGVAERRQQPISGYVLYSKNGQMKTVPMEDVRRERRILRARNELIALHRSFVDPDYDYTPPYFMQFPSNCNASSCNFRRGRCQEQTRLLSLGNDVATATSPAGAWANFDGALVEKAWAYHEHFTRLIEMERWAENTAMGAILQSSRLSERVANHYALEGATIVATDALRQQVHFAIAAGQIFSPGDYVLAHQGDLNASHILRALCVSSDDEGIVLSSPGAASASSLPAEGWILDKLPSRIGFRTAHKALYRTLHRRDRSLLTVLLEPKSLKAQKLMGDDDGQNADITLEGRTTNALNPTQQRAVRAALGAEVCCLIQGPPGTGKTTVIAHLVGELVDREQRVLLSALTNTAVDTLLIKLLEAGQADFIRLGSASRSRELSAALRERGFDPAFFFSDDLARQTESLSALAGRLNSCRTIATTAHGSVSSPVFEHLKQTCGEVPFDVTIIDEASQLTEPMTLGPMSMAKRFVLVGDHRQLPPIVVSEQSQSSALGGDVFFGAESDEAPPQLDLFGNVINAGLGQVPYKNSQLSDALAEMNCAGLDRSLFERLAMSLPHVMLDVQYRMHEDIMAFSSEAFYGGRLKAHDSNRHHGFDETPVVFVDVDVESDGRTNAPEAEAIIAALEALAPMLHELSVGVVTPFRAQAHLLRQMLARHPLLAGVAIDVDTVERFQGSERDVIMVSLVKTDRAGEFLADPRRLNVTLTRARKKLMLFGHRRCLELNPLFRRLLEQPKTTTATWTPERT